jgi:hypothetical protein
MLQRPLEITSVGSGWIIAMRVLRDGGAGLTFKPFMDFRVAIREAEAIGTVVIAGWQSVDPTARVTGADDDEAIVDAVGMFIHKHSQIGRRGPEDIALLVVLAAVERIAPRGNGRVAIAETEAVTVHGVAAHAWQVRAAQPGRIGVGRALIDTDVPVDISAQFGFPEEGKVGVVRVVRGETEPATNPAVGDRTRGKGLVIDQNAVNVVGVEQPGEGRSLVVGHALDGA